MKKGLRSRNNMKIIDLQQELGLSDDRLRRILQELRVFVEEGQRNLDQNEVGRIRQWLNEQRRREELKRQTITIPSIIKVQNLAGLLEVSVGDVLAALLKNGVMATVNDDLDYETAGIIASDLGYATEESVTALEKDVLTPEKLAEILKKEKEGEQKIRPPVVTILGHVDHGKTTLLDAIRSANVATHEAGGITQAISSYEVEYKERTITFIDTPGHATFQLMRQRGARLADVAVLVVAADDGVKPQTKEAIDHIKKGKIPLVVAINKVDKSTANTDKVKRELGELDLLAEDWGGKVVMVPISALKKQGIDDLLDMILLTADLHPPKAAPDRAALGTVVESKLDKNLGPLATVLIHTGTLHAGDNIVVGRAAGRIRRLLDFRGKIIKSANPSMPVTIVGLDHVPRAGDIMQAVEAKGEARLKAAERRAPIKSLNKGDKDDERSSLVLVIKADSQGALEAITSTIEAMVPPEVRLAIIRSDVGYVSDSDVLTAHAAHGLIYAFNTSIGGMTRRLAEKEHVPVKTFAVIYHLADDVRQEIEKRLPIDIIHTELGRLKVLKVFFSIQRKKIIGGEITQGKAEAQAKATVTRKQGAIVEEVGQGTITEMQREKRAITQAEQGDQVGLTYEGKGKIKPGDVLVIYREDRIKRQLVPA